MWLFDAADVDGHWSLKPLSTAKEMMERWSICFNCIGSPGLEMDGIPRLAVAALRALRARASRSSMFLDVMKSVMRVDWRSFLGCCDDGFGIGLKWALPLRGADLAVVTT